MKLYLRMMLAGLMALPAADGLRHGDIWLCGSFAAGAAFVLASNRLFGETVESEATDKPDFRRPDVQPSGIIAIGRTLKKRLTATVTTLDARQLACSATSSRQPRRQRMEILRY